MCECVSFEWLEKKRALDESNEIHSTTKMCILSLVACISTHFKCKMCSLRIFTGSRNTHDDYFDSKSRTANAMCIPNSQSHCFSDIIQLTIARHASHSIQQCTNTTSGKTHIYFHARARVREREKEPKWKSFLRRSVAYISIFNCIMHEVATIAASLSSSSSTR